MIENHQNDFLNHIIVKEISFLSKLTNFLDFSNQSKEYLKLISLRLYLAIIFNIFLVYKFRLFKDCQKLN